MKLEFHLHGGLGDASSFLTADRARVCELRDTGSSAIVGAPAPGRDDNIPWEAWRGNRLVPEIRGRARAAAAEYVEVLDGIHDGDSVVVDGNLLIDIESNPNSALKALSALRSFGYRSQPASTPDASQLLRTYS